MLWFPLALLATLGMAAYVILSKQMLTTAKTAAVGYAALIQTLVGLFSLALLPFFGVQATLNRESIFLTLLVGLLYTFTSGAYYLAMKHLEASRLTILVSLDAVIIQLAAFFLLGEPLTLGKILAVLLIFLAIILITLSPETFRLALNRYDLLALANATVYSLNTLIDKYLLTHYYSPLTYQVPNYLLPGLFLFLLFPRGRQTARLFFQPRKRRVTLLLAATTLFFTFLAVFSAYQQGGEASRILPILGTQTLLVVILGAIFLKERGNLARKLLASLLAIAGIFLMKT